MITEALAALVVSIFLVFYAKIRKDQSYWKEKQVPHRPPKFLLGDFGEMFLKRKSIMDIIKDVYNAFPETRYSGMYSLTYPGLLIKDPEIIKRITVKDFDHFTDHRPFIPEEADHIWGKNLLSLKGQRWKNMRATLSPAFTGSKMRQIFLLINECSKNLAKYFEENSQEASSVEMKDTCRRFATDVIATSAFGVTTDSFKDKENQFYLMGREVAAFDTFKKKFAFMAYMVFPKLAMKLGLQLFDKSIGRFFKDMVMTCIKEREEKSISRLDMIQILMEAKKELLKNENPVEGKTLITDDDIASQAVIFFFAGFDTVSTIMSFMAYELAVDPDIQKKLQQEIDEVLSQNNGELTYDMLSQMKYLDMVVSETLRKWPPTMAMDRLCTKPYTIQPVYPWEKPLNLEEGDFISIPQIAIQRDSKYFPNPDKFDPERFSDENKSRINPYTYMPFGLGPRICIGSRFALLETKTMMVNLLSKFDLEVTEKTQIPIVISKKDATLTTEGGIWLKFKSRSSEL